MKLNVIITGSTGMVGKGGLPECLESSFVESALVINRRPVEVVHDKKHSDNSDINLLGSKSFLQYVFFYLY